MSVVLLDGDALAWRIALRAERQPAPAREAAAIAEFSAWADDLVAALGGGALRIALGGGRSFRCALFAGYKAGRRRRAKPSALSAVYDHAREAHGAIGRPSLEADDLLGVWATEAGADAGADAPGCAAPPPADPVEARFAARLRAERAGEAVLDDAEPGASPARRIIVSPDKDLATVPGLHVKTLRPAKGWRPSVVTPRAADRAHLRQTLIGDAADGYPGCPGVGPKTADAFLARPYRLRRVGAAWRRGWTAADGAGLWAGVLSLFEKAGRSAEDALLQARLARILRAEDLGPDGAPILWSPSKLNQPYHL